MFGGMHETLKAVEKQKEELQGIRRELLCVIEAEQEEPGVGHLEDAKTMLQRMEEIVGS